MKWQSSSNYSSKEMAAMQKDAMERVREMQRRADESLRRSNPPPSSPPPSPPAPAPMVENPTYPEPLPQLLSPEPSLNLPNLLSNGKLGNILSAAGIDQDRLILLGLLLVLWNDSADRKLLLALVYLLL